MRHLGRGPAAAARAHSRIAVAPVGPVTARQREPILDVLRGFALLGILLINIGVMRGADLYRVLLGQAGAPADTAERVLHFLLAWLVEGKFLSSFAIMFGVGTALIATRTARSTHPPRVLLLRRYALLALFGLTHMLLLFPGDILFVYGIAGMVLLAFVGVRAGSALWWAAGILSVVLLLGVGVALLGGGASAAPEDDPFVSAVEEFAVERQDLAITARQEGDYADVVVANAWESLAVQASVAPLLPWIVALFLVGFAVGRSGLLADLAGQRRRVRTAMVTGLGAGLPLNLPIALLERPLLGTGTGTGDASLLLELLSTVGQVVGAPLLAIGYLSALALLCLRAGPIRPLAAVGRMALTGYLLQSVLAVVVFVGFGLYDRVSPLQSMGVVLGIWVVLLVVCPLWLRSFNFGPAEWLWRTLTYGRRQPLRAR